MWRDTISLTNSAWVQASGMAEPVGLPGNRNRSGSGSASQTCSGIIPPGPVIAAIAFR
jgi:hypothetical protein